MRVYIYNACNIMRVFQIVRLSDDTYLNTPINVCNISPKQSFNFSTMDEIALRVNFKDLLFISKEDKEKLWEIGALMNSDLDAVLSDVSVHIS